MSPARKAFSSLESWGLLAAGIVLMAWYAYPQVLYSLYPLYELLRLLFPDWLPDLSPAAKSILDRFGLPG